MRIETILKKLPKHLKEDGIGKADIWLCIEYRSRVWCASYITYSTDSDCPTSEHRFYADGYTSALEHKSRSLNTALLGLLKKYKKFIAYRKIIYDEPN